MLADGNSIKGLVFNIQKFSIHDGIGIRTLVFLKGCPLRCQWCSNPESQSINKEVMFLSEKCIGCGDCVKQCPNHCIDTDNFTVDRIKCDGCGNCSIICHTNAKTIVGQWMTVHQVMQEVEKDRIFYYNSNGGITIGGGEPFTQIEFLKELLKECTNTHLHTAIETCGYASWDTIKEAFNYIDQVFYDLKHMDSDRHFELTGVRNEIIIENAIKLADFNKEIIFRLALIPGINDDETNMNKTGEFISSLTKKNQNIKVQLLPYHNLGESKYQGIGQEYVLAGLKIEGEEKKAKYKKVLTNHGCIVID